MWTWPWRRRRPDPDLPPEVARFWRDWQDWRPSSPRARAVIVLAAAATAAGLLWMMLQPQLRLEPALQRAARTPPAGPASAPAVDAGCGSPGRPGCPGGKLDVFVLPSTSTPASAPGATPSR